MGQAETISAGDAGKRGRLSCGGFFEVALWSARVACWGTGSRERIMQRPGGVGFAAVRLETGVRLHYAGGGDGVGEAIVFLHAFAGSWFWFSLVLPLLSPGYRVLVPDQRGHGKSD